MALPTIRRRLGKLENVFVVDRFAGYPPLTTQEIEALAKRMAEGQEWADVETGRIVKQCPIIQGRNADHGKPRRGLRQALPRPRSGRHLKELAPISCQIESGCVR